MLIGKVFSTGKSWHEKIKEVRGTLTKKKADALVVTALDEVACKESNICFKYIIYGMLQLTICLNNISGANGCLTELLNCR